MVFSLDATMDICMSSSDSLPDIAKILHCDSFLEFVESEQLIRVKVFLALRKVSSFDEILVIILCKWSHLERCLYL